jgi:hypothetical protein
MCERKRDSGLRWKDAPWIISFKRQSRRHTCGAVSTHSIKKLRRKIRNKKGTEVPFFIEPEINAKPLKLRRR